MPSSAGVRRTSSTSGTSPKPPNRSNTINDDQLKFWHASPSSQFSFDDHQFDYQNIDLAEENHFETFSFQNLLAQDEDHNTASVRYHNIEYGAFNASHLRLNTGIDPTSHWTSEQWTLLARRSEYRWDISNRSSASSSRDPSSYKIRNVSADRN